jgi:hypothetical protein
VVLFIVLGGGDDDAPSGAAGDLSNPLSGNPLSGNPLSGNDAPSIPGSGVPGIPGVIPGLSAECVALVQAFTSIGALYAGGTVNTQQVNQQLAAAAQGANLPSQIRTDLNTISSLLGKAGGYASLTTAETNQLDAAMDRVSDYGDSTCVAR